MTSDDALRDALDEMAAATDRLLETVDGLGPDDVGAPSGLPGWSRGHVLTHLARNADAFARLVVAARTGEPGAMYPGGPEQRDAEIAAGAARHLGDLRLDLADSAERLLEAYAGGFPAEARDREVAMPRGGSAYGAELPLLRTREVEIHHVDLAAGYSPADWAASFATRTLDQLAPLFREARECPVGTLVAADGSGRWPVAATGPALSGPVTALAGWLVGRDDGAALELSPPAAGGVPPAPRWV